MNTRSQNFKDDLLPAGFPPGFSELPPKTLRQFEVQLQALVDNAFERASQRAVATTGSRGRSLDKKEVLARVGGSSSTLYNRLCKTSGYFDAKFPKPVKEGRRSYWAESEIDSYVASRIATRDGGKEVQ